MKIDKEKQNTELIDLRSISLMLEKKTNIKADKLNAVDQHSRRQKLECHGVPKSENEDIKKVVINISKVLGVNVEKHHISAAYKMPKRPIVSWENDI